MIPALVLTAGIATRLRPLSHVRAKAALPVAGVPLVHRILRSLAGGGVSDAVLNLHHLPHTITGSVGDGSQLGVRVRYSWERRVLGSAGGPRRAIPLLAASRFLIVNGDTLTNVDVGALLADHERNGALVTMALVPNTEPHKYGGVLVDDEGRVAGFTRRGSPERSFHFIGVQVAERDAFAHLPDETPYESIGALYPELMRARGGAVRAYVSDAEFLDIGTPLDYLETSLRLAAREGWPIENDCILWDGAAVAHDARLRRCIVTDGARVPGGADWSDVVIRRADGPLESYERREGELAIAPLPR